MIDIIIPFYNSEKTINTTLESIIEQKDTPDINVYIIDDHSDEDYSYLVDKYRERLLINYLRLDKNYGPGVARQRGLECSSAEYIIFLDSDDRFYDDKSINTLYKAISKSNSDVVRSVIYEETNEGYREYVNDNIGLHGKIYRREFLRKNNIRFNETRSNEDTAFNLQIKLCGAYYYNIPYVTYVWCNNPASITRSKKENYYDTDKLYYSLNVCGAIYEANNKVQNFGIIARECIVQNVELYYRYKEAKDECIKNKIKDLAKELFKLLNTFKEYTIYDFINSYDLLKLYREDEYKDSFYWVTDGDIDEKNFEIKHKNIKFCSTSYSESEVKEREKHLKLMKEYNNTEYDNYSKRNEIRQKIFAHFGQYSEIVPPFQANCGGKNVYVGDGTYINFSCSMVDDGNIYIGDNVCIGPNVNLITVNHPVNTELRLRRVICKQEVRICNNVWIGAGAIILPGVTIGKNSVIGAGSVVTKDIPSNVLALGNPCKVVKEI